MLRPYVVRRDPRRLRDADPSPVAHADVHARFFRDAGRLETTPFERYRRPLHAPPQRVRSTVGPAARALEQPLDHAAAPEGTSPPTSASSMRTCGAPSVTGRGACPPLPQPPPIWFQRKSPAM